MYTTVILIEQVLEGVVAITKNESSAINFLITHKYIDENTNVELYNEEKKKTFILLN